MELPQRLGTQRLVLDCQLCRGPQRPCELGLVHEGGVVQHESKRPPAPGDPGDPAPGDTQLSGISVLVDELIGIPARVHHVDAGIAHRCRKCVAQRSGRRSLSEVARESRHAFARTRDSQDGPGEAEREHRVRERAGHEYRGESGALRILHRSAQKGDRVCSFGCADQHRRPEQRKHSSACRATRGTQPVQGESDQTNGDGDGGPEPDVAEGVGKPGSRIHQKRVVAAVAPAVEVEQRVAEQRASDAHRRSARVRRPERGTGRRRADASSWQRERKVGDEHQCEWRDQGAKAAQYRRRLLRSVPVGAKPGESSEHREHAESPRSLLTEREPASHEQPEAGGDVGHPERGEGGGVARMEVRTGIDGEQRRNRPGERERGEASIASAIRWRSASPPSGDSLTGTLLPATGSQERILWPAAMCRAPGDLTVFSSSREELQR